MNFLSIYSSYEQIDREVLQLVYYCKLSYIDCQYMTHFQRQWWLKEISTILENEAKAKAGQESLI